MIAFPACKINIGLNILAKRNDGFHSIESVLFPVPWTDVLEIIQGESSANKFEYRSTGIRLFGPKEKNLCLRACQLMAQNYDLPPVRIHLHKVIPVGAGLGGGSSDASNTLLLLNKIFRLNISENVLMDMAAELGSDCPFFIRNKACLATSKGEVLQPVSLKLKNYFLVIVKPRVHVSTAEAYSMVKPASPPVPLKELISRPLTEWKDNIKNDFESGIFEKFPGVKNIKLKLYKLGAVYASMSGSGSAVYGIFEKEKNLAAYFRSCTVWQGIL